MEDIKMEYSVLLECDVLRKFITEQGKILPRRRTKLSAKKHRQITKAIKKARVLGALPFINKK